MSSVLRYETNEGIERYVMKWGHCASILTVLSLLFSQSAGAEPYKVVFETMDCNGNTGFATLGPDEIYKIENGDCTDPEHPGQKLKKMLVHDGSGSYKIFTLSQDEARNVMQDIKEYMKARKGVLEKSNSVIITQ